MTNPYQTPETKFEPKPVMQSGTPAVQDFFAWYFGAFIASASLFFLSRYVRQFDLLEVPMATLLFPWGVVIDPHDGMVNDHNMFLYGVAWWMVMGAVALAGRRYANALRIALAIESAVVVGGISYALYVVVVSRPPVCY